MRVSILPIGPVDVKVLEVLERRLPEFLPIEEAIILEDVLKVPEEAYDPRRRQYRSSTILSLIMDYRPSPDDERVLGVTGVDLYAPGLNFIFGEAMPWRGPAVISLHRLRPEYYRMPPDEDLFLERVLKEAVHELGHTLGLGHCADTGCVMFFSNSIQDTDRKGVKLCELCYDRIQENLARSFDHQGSGEDGLKRLFSGIAGYAEELGLDLSKPEDRFKWFLASMLFAKRISSEIAMRTYRRFEEEGLTTPEAILEAGWERLVEVLDSGGYARYDFSTASNLLEAVGKLVREYGDLERLHEASADPRDLERRLMEFRGIGPVGVNIFLRELRGIWMKADPEPSRIALEVASRLGIREVKQNESALVRIGLEYCRRRRCDQCQFNDHCRKWRLEMRNISTD